MRKKKSEVKKEEGVSHENLKDAYNKCVIEIKEAEDLIEENRSLIKLLLNKMMALGISHPMKYEFSKLITHLNSERDKAKITIYDSQESLTRIANQMKEKMLSSKI